MGSPVEGDRKNKEVKKAEEEPPPVDTKNLFNFKHITEAFKKKEILKTSILELDYDCEPKRSGIKSKLGVKSIESSIIKENTSERSSKHSAYQRETASN